MEAEDLIEDAYDDAAWIFDTYHEEGDDAHKQTHSNTIRRRLRNMAKRHRLMALQLERFRNGST